MKETTFLYLQLNKNHTHPLKKAKSTTRMFASKAPSAFLSSDVNAKSNISMLALRRPSLVLLGIAFNQLN